MTDSARPGAPPYGRIGELAALAVGLIAVALVLAYYLHRIAMPMPLYASDEATYLIRALLPAELVAQNPNVAAVNNGAFLAVVRAVNPPGPDDLPWLRAVNLLAYLGGLVFLHRVTTKALPRRDQWVFLLLAVGFPYYRFVIAALPEACYVGVVAAMAIVTGKLFRPRPLVHAAITGALCAILVLIKPHGVAVVRAVGALMVLDGVSGGGLLRLPGRIAVAAVTFLAAGNAIQFAVGQHVVSPLTFFVGDFYGGALSKDLPPGALLLGALAALSMLAATALMAGPALVLGLKGVWEDWRERRQLDGPALLLLLVVLSLLATLAMVTLFAMKVSGDPGETKRLWGRYFEFYIPLVWLAAAPFIVRQETEGQRGMNFTCVAVALAGLGGLLLSFKAGIVLLPWDATALMAFFAPDPIRAPLGAMTPYRAYAIGATLLAVFAMIWGLRPSRAWVALLLAFGLLSTALDRLWMGPMLDAREAFAADLDTVEAKLPPKPAKVAMLTADLNSAHMGYFGLDGRPAVYLAQPGQVMPVAAEQADALVAIAPDIPTSEGWKRTWHGAQMSLYVRKVPAAP